MTAGTQTMTPGTYFPTDHQYRHRLDDLRSPARLRPLHPNQYSRRYHDPHRGGPVVNQALTGTITSTTKTPGAFPAPGPPAVPTDVNIQGVVARGGGPTGNMTMTTHQGSGAPVVTTYTGPVSINTSTNVLNAESGGAEPWPIRASTGRRPRQTGAVALGAVRGDRPHARRVIPLDSTGISRQYRWERMVRGVRTLSCPGKSGAPPGHGRACGREGHGGPFTPPWPPGPAASVSGRRRGPRGPSPPPPGGTPGPADPGRRVP